MYTFFYQHRGCQNASNPRWYITSDIFIKDLPTVCPACNQESVNYTFYVNEDEKKINNIRPLLIVQHNQSLYDNCYLEPCQVDNTFTLQGIDEESYSTYLQKIFQHCKEDKVSLLNIYLNNEIFNYMHDHCPEVLVQSPYPIYKSNDNNISFYLYRMKDSLLFSKLFSNLDRLTLLQKLDYLQFTVEKKLKRQLFGFGLSSDCYMQMENNAVDLRYVKYTEGQYRYKTLPIFCIDHIHVPLYPILYPEK